MATVGIIANPASGKDIRRLVAYGTVFDNQEKVNIVRRILLSLEAAGVDRVLYMPDYYGIVTKAAAGISCGHTLSLEIEPLDMVMTCMQQDSMEAAKLMRGAGVGCLITLGGDGTNRMVAKGCGDIPLLPVSTGTNNVFPVMVEGTIAGLAAGIAARRKETGASQIRRAKKLILYKNGQPADIALVDAVVINDVFAGSRAVWKPESLLEAVLTRGEPHNLGMSAIGGVLTPISPTEPRGLVLKFGGSLSVLAPMAPGLIAPVAIKSHAVIEAGQSVQIEARPCVIALDGEREVEVVPGDDVRIELTLAGPLVVDIKAILAEAVQRQFFRR